MLRLSRIAPLPVVLLVALSAAEGARAPVQKDTRAVRVILVRHAEAEPDGDDPPLEPEGAARARCLVDALRGQRVTHLFSSTKMRAQQTLAPLAAERHLDVVLRDPMDVDALASELAALPAGSCAVVAGHSNTLPLIALSLGTQLSDLVDEAGQKVLRRTEHDRLVVIDLHPRVKSRRRVVSIDERRYGCVAGP